MFIDDQPTFCVGAQAVGVRPIQIARGEPNGYASRWDFPVVRTLLEAQPAVTSRCVRSAARRQGAGS